MAINWLNRIALLLMEKLISKPSFKLTPSEILNLTCRNIFSIERHSYEDLKKSIYSSEIKAIRGAIVRVKKIKIDE